MAPPTTEQAAAACDQLLEGSLLLSEAGFGDADGGANGSSRFPEHVLPPRVAQARVRAMRVTDAQPRVNLASFVTTAIEPECLEVVEEALAVNRIDAEEYGSMDLMCGQALAWLSDLWHAPPLKPGEQPAGADTVGSSEAVLLAGAAAKRRWSERRRAAGLPTDKPNIVLPTDAHVVWEKLANYFELEARWGESERGLFFVMSSSVSLSSSSSVFFQRPGGPTQPPPPLPTHTQHKQKQIPVPAPKGEAMSRVEDLADAADENTVLIMAILGTTFTCSYYDIEKLDALVAAKNAAHPDWQLGIHVDAASGGFIAPFATPDLKWDFRLDNVVSINSSGHKFGQCLAGIGWVLFRSPAFLPQSLIFADAYLGAAQTTLTLNFSKSASGLVNAMFMFQRLGRKGYTALANHMFRNAALLRGEFLLLLVVLLSLLFCWRRRLLWRRRRGGGKGARRKGANENAAKQKTPLNKRQNKTKKSQRPSSPWATLSSSPTPRPAASPPSSSTSRTAPTAARASGTSLTWPSACASPALSSLPTRWPPATSRAWCCAC